jgi:hypothetical protein
MFCCLRVGAAAAILVLLALSAVGVTAAGQCGGFCDGPGCGSGCYCDYDKSTCVAGHANRTCESFCLSNSDCANATGGCTACVEFNCRAPLTPAPDSEQCYNPCDGGQQDCAAGCVCHWGRGMGHQCIPYGVAVRKGMVRTPRGVKTPGRRE